MVEIIGLTAINLSSKAGGVLTGKYLQIVIYIVGAARPLFLGHGNVLIGHFLEEAVILSGYTGLENVACVQLSLNRVSFPYIGYIGVILCLYGSNDLT